MYTVTQINQYIKTTLEYDDKLQNIFVIGEVADYRPNRSGHIYFTLKDEQTQISAVMFKWSAERLKFAFENGARVLVRGKISCYEQRGVYQLYCDDIMPDGVGQLSLAFEQLKQKLEKEGFFSQENKKSVPDMPLKIGVATSSTGAAVHDIFSILERRFPLAEIVFIPVKVQGDGAAAEISRAIEIFNNKTDVEIIIIGRGGGASPDLWAFNEECVARAIFNSEIPVISAVGHETDFTIADFVADLRAATPSAAAELCSYDYESVLNSVSAYVNHCKLCVLNITKSLQNDLIEIQSQIEYFNPIKIIEREALCVDYNFNTIVSSINRIVLNYQNELKYLIDIIDAKSPMNILKNGFSIVKNNEITVKSVEDVKVGDTISVITTDGKFNATVI